MLPRPTSTKCLVSWIIVFVSANVVWSDSDQSFGWVQPCHTSREACDRACGVEKRLSLFWTCHNETGYCLCPTNSIPKAHCRRAKNKREMNNCKTSICADLRKKQISHKSAEMGDYVRSQKDFKKAITQALICSNEKEDNVLHCACFSGVSPFY